MEALVYFKNKKKEFAPNAFSRKEAVDFCKKLYKLGVLKIEIDQDDYHKDDEDMFADCMHLVLPKSLSKRLDILAIIFNLETRPDEVGSNNLFGDTKVNWRKDKIISLWWD